MQLQCFQEYDWMYLCIVLMWIVFKSVSESRKDALLKIPAFCLHETKKFRLKWNRLIEDASKNLNCDIGWLWHTLTIEKLVYPISWMQKLFKKNLNFLKVVVKKMRHGQYNLINEILTNWYKKCTIASLFPDGSMLKEVAMLINER